MVQAEPMQAAQDDGSTCHDTSNDRGMKVSRLGPISTPMYQRKQYLTDFTLPYYDSRGIVAILLMWSFHGQLVEIDYDGNNKRQERGCSSTHGKYSTFEGLGRAGVEVLPTGEGNSRGFPQ